MAILSSVVMISVKLIILPVSLIIVIVSES